jgi:hypothetical protein
MCPGGLEHQRGELIQTIRVGLRLRQQGKRDQGVRRKQIESRGTITRMGQHLVESRLSGAGENVRK